MTYLGTMLNCPVCRYVCVCLCLGMRACACARCLVFFFNPTPTTTTTTMYLLLTCCCRCRTILCHEWWLFFRSFICSLIIVYTHSESLDLTLHHHIYIHLSIQHTHKPTCECLPGHSSLAFPFVSLGYAPSCNHRRGTGSSPICIN